jgi:SRSO17 transposase
MMPGPRCWRTCWGGWPGCFPRRETRQSCRHLVSGLLTELDDRNCWTIAEAADEKSSADAVGAARQYSDTLGGIELCQVAVTLAYATPIGHALIGRALYLPEACALYR